MPDLKQKTSELLGGGLDAYHANSGSKRQVPAIFKTGQPGVMEDSNSYAFGRWMGEKAVPTVTGPILNATRPVETSFGTIPGMANALVSGGAGGALLGGLWNKFINKGDFSKGALLGGLAGAGGMGLLRHVTSGDDWMQRTPVLKMFAPREPTRIAGSQRPMGPTGPLSDETYDEIRESLPGGHEKPAAWGQMGGADTAGITRKIFQDSKLTLMQKQELVNQVKNLNAQQAQKLNMLVGSAWGGGVGLVIAKYLLGLGKFGTILTTIAAGLIGAGANRGPSPKPTHDAYGRPYYM